MVNNVAAFLGWPQGNTCQTDDDHGCQNESTSSTHSMNNRGPRTKPCGTLNYNTKVKFYEPATHHMRSHSYLLPDRDDIPAFTPAEAGIQLSDPGGMQG